MRTGWLPGCSLAGKFGAKGFVQTGLVVEWAVVEAELAGNWARRRSELELAVAWIGVGACSLVDMVAAVAAAGTVVAVENSHTVWVAVASVAVAGNRELVRMNSAVSGWVVGVLGNCWVRIGAVGFDVPADDAKLL